jgi:glycerophosphoryl diester phosphodiesterase
MRAATSGLALVALAAELTAAVPLKPRWQHPENEYLVSLGPRPYYLVQNMTDGPLKQALEACYNKPVTIQPWSIGHRGGGTLQIPEETMQSIEAGSRMGAGVQECDVAFTADRGLVCRHDICDLHRTTDILLRPELAAKVSMHLTTFKSTSVRMMLQIS